jgi:hypothetical protein
MRSLLWSDDTFSMLRSTNIRSSESLLQNRNLGEHIPL